MFTEYRLSYFFLKLTVTQIPAAERKRLWPSLGSLPASLLFMLDKMKTKACMRDWARLWICAIHGYKGLSGERYSSLGLPGQPGTELLLLWAKLDIYFFPPVPAVSKWADAPPAGKNYSELQNSASSSSEEKAITEISKHHLMSADKKVAKMWLV